MQVPRLGQSPPEDGPATDRRIPQRAQVDGPLVSRYPEHGEGVVHPAQHGGQPSSQATATSGSLMETVRPAGGGGDGSQRGEPASGDLGVLGASPGSSDGAIHTQEATEGFLRRLRVSQLARLLNATPLGEVVNERQIYRHRMRSGDRFCVAGRMDLYAYGAWLVQQRHSARRGRRCATVSVGEVWDLLRRQAFRCALSGRPLTPESAALDHILPVSRGGKHSIENAQVLHKEVNRAKGTLTNEEFIQLCREVVEHVGRQEEQGGKA